METAEKRAAAAAAAAQEAEEKVLHHFPSATISWLTQSARMTVQVLVHEAEDVVRPSLL